MKEKISMQTKDRNHDLGNLICEQNKVLGELLIIIHDEFKWRRSTQGLATKKDLETLGDKIMSVLSDFAAKQKSFNERIGAAIDGISTDIEALNAKITELQNSPGAITPEDQAALDAIQAAGEALAAKTEALDSMNPPNPPPS